MTKSKKDEDVAQVGTAKKKRKEKKKKSLTRSNKVKVMRQILMHHLYVVVDVPLK
jgi:hypothetical protein